MKSDFTPCLSEVELRRGPRPGPGQSPEEPNHPTPEGPPDPWLL
ncbi:hypothetical protein [Kiloniella laminariae]|nr:hypothetical protein [Kiloniella laminariae]